VLDIAVARDDAVEPSRCMSSADPVTLTPVASRRRRIIAAMLSGVFPGLGQLYKRDWLKAVVFTIGGILTAFGPLSPMDIDIDLDNPTPGLRYLALASLPFLVVALWSVIDAYRVPKRAAA
jgi:hypothetical protein